MSDISHIDASFLPKSVPAERSPAQNFADELAKAVDGKMTGDMHPKNDSVENHPLHTFTDVSKPHAAVLPVAHAFSRMSAGITTGITTQEQLSVAVQPTGITEALLGSRVFGVHLLASTYLSELAARGAVDPEVVADAALQEMVSTPSQTHALSSDVSSDLNATAPSKPLHEDAVAMLSLLLEGEATAAVSHQPSSGAVSIAAAQASTFIWPESSLRLIKQHDGSSVVWLRDYRMPSEDASHLIDSLVKGAEVKGVRLGRIVLNGREIWVSHKNY